MRQKASIGIILILLLAGGYLYYLLLFNAVGEWLGRYIATIARMVASPGPTVGRDLFRMIASLVGYYILFFLPYILCCVWILWAIFRRKKKE